MPRTKIDYSKSVIYMLKKKDDYDNENIYIGSTTDLTRRRYNHRNNCCNPSINHYNNKKYQYIRENGGWDEWIMIVIENYPCNNKLELVKREDEIMCEMKSKLNTNRANRNKKEYREANKERITEKTKEYRENNKEKIAEYHKEYRENNKEKEKEYYENNKEKLLEYQKEYRKNNKEKIAEYQKEKIKCDKCGLEVSRIHLSRHKKSMKCIRY